MRNLLGAVVLCTGAVNAEPLTIAALGDSLTQGYGLAPEQGLVPQLERWLLAQGADVTLINAGVSGDTTQGGLSRAAWTLTPEVDAMIVALGGNDMLRGVDPAVSKANLDGILAVGQEQGVDLMLVGMTAPGNYGPDYKRDFDGMYPVLAQKYDAVFVESLLAPVSDAIEGGSALQEYMQGDGIHPNAKGVALIVEALGPKVMELIARAE